LGLTLGARTAGSGQHEENLLIDQSPQVNHQNISSECTQMLRQSDGIATIPAQSGHVAVA